MDKGMNNRLMLLKNFQRVVATRQSNIVFGKTGIE
jgi:hypothetical protein